MSGPAAEIRSDEAVRRSYLGYWRRAWHGLLHQLLSGIATGGIYASVALALVMIYQATHHVNFAQGEMAMFSTYIACTLIEAGCALLGVRSSSTVAVSFVDRRR